MKKYLKPSVAEIQVNALYALMDQTGEQAGNPDTHDMAPARNW